MPRIRPFAGLLYDTTVVGPLEMLTTPPYDVITAHDRERFHAESRFNVVRLIQGQDLPGDDDRSNRYTRAAATLQLWRNVGALVPTRAAAVFPYEFRFHDHGRVRTVRGLVAEVELEPFGRGVLPHERTMAGPVRDRLALLRAVRANLSPVHAVYPGPVEEVRAFLEETVLREPARETTDDAGTRHRLWIRTDGEAVCRALGDQPLMIADGHHRYAVALAFMHEMNATAGAGAWDRLMMLLVDAASEEPPVLPIHRALLAVPRSADPRTSVRADHGQGDGSGRVAWPGSSAAAPGHGRVRDLVEMLSSLADEDLTIGVVRHEHGELTYRVARLLGTPPAVLALHREVLEGVHHGELAFLHDPVSAEEMVRDGRASAAFFLPPTRVETVRRVVAEGNTLPEKSTYFWPKPRTGMLIRPFDA